MGYPEATFNISSTKSTPGSIEHNISLFCRYYGSVFSITILAKYGYHIGDVFMCSYTCDTLSYWMLHL